MSTLHSPNDAYGWLSTGGTYHDVEGGCHADYMENELDIDCSEAERTGWIHLADGCYSHCGTGLCSRLTPEQRRWLVKVGFDLHKGDEE